MTRNKHSAFATATARIFTNAAPPGYPTWVESQRQMIDEAALPADKLTTPCAGCGSRLPLSYYRDRGLIACCPARNADKGETIT